MSPDIQKAAVGDVEIAYETFGDPADPALLLVMGLGTQMLAWPDPFCAQLADGGRYVIRFDNRDVGLSTHLEGVRAPAPAKVVVRRARVPYTISDLARDAVGLLDALDIGPADVVGVSMGGFIAQTMAIKTPERVRTLTLMMTSTGGKTVGYPHPRVGAELLRRRRTRDREGAVEAAVEVFKLIGSPGYALDEEYLQRQAGVSYDRAYDPAGYLRQLAACLAQPDRTRDLRKLDVPTLVMHGLHDPLISASGGLALARSIPGAKFVGFSGMGHDLPQPLWSPMAEEILGLVRRGAATALR
jgi:pimeloyl-ACP methyl ester carboxylesterase